MRTRILAISLIFSLILVGCSKPESVIPAAEWEDDHPDVMRPTLETRRWKRPLLEAQCQ